MIGTALVFMLGFLVACLLALLLAPLVWRRAERFARRRFDAEIPVSVREMRGEIDAARARAAFDLRGAEMRADEVRARATTERAEAGRIVLENGGLLRRQNELDAEVREAARRHEALEAVLAETRAERDEVGRDRERLREAFEKRGAEIERRGAELERYGSQIEELRARHAGAQTRAAQAEARLAALERPIATAGRAASDSEAPGESLPAAGPAAPAPPLPLPVALLAPAAELERPPSGGERLRAAIAAGVSARTPATPAQNAQIRERISDLAARILRRNADEAGAASPVGAILAAAPRETGGTEAPSLAERVRALSGEPASAPPADAEPAGDPEGPPPEAPVPAGAVKSGEARTNGAGRSRRRSRR